MGGKVRAEGCLSNLRDGKHLLMRLLQGIHALLERDIVWRKLGLATRGVVLLARALSE